MPQWKHMSLLSITKKKKKGEQLGTQKRKQNALSKSHSSMNKIIM